MKAKNQIRIIKEIYDYGITKNEETPFIKLMTYAKPFLIIFDDNILNKNSIILASILIDSFLMSKIRKW